jgi:peptidoglycan/LPS O-acetylase OafA/YrhL
MSTDKRQLDALTGIRFFLALWVVVYHQANSLLESFGGPALLHRALEPLILTGYTAVSVFFILSGFVLTYNYDLATLRRTRNAVRFGIARFSRIYPAYVTGLLLLVPFAIYRVIVGVVVGETGMTKFILNACLLQSWVPGAELSWNYPGWSLSDEAFFYAVLPVAGIWIARVATGSVSRAVPRLLGLAAVLWVLSLVMPFFAILRPVPHFGDAAATDMELLGAGAWAGVIRYNPLLRLPEFCIGVVVALLYRMVPAGSRLWKRGAYFYIPAIIIILSVLVNGARIPYPIVHNGLLAPAYAVMIFGLALEGGVLARFLSRPVLVFLGSASYTMYILHAPVSAWLTLIFVHILQLVPDGLFWFVCYLCVVVGLSALVFKFAEEPMHRWLRSKLSTWVEDRIPVLRT